MTKMFDLLPGWIYVAIIVAMGCMIGMQQIRISSAQASAANARAELANTKTQYAQAAQAAESAARIEERRRIDAAQKVIKDAQNQAQTAQAAADDANRAAAGLQRRVASLIAAARTSPANPSSPGRGEGKQDSDALDLLGRVLAESDKAAGDLAGYADKLDIAGRACERAYDSLRPAEQ